MKIILIETRNVYGNELTYPLNHCKELLALTGRKTISAGQIEALQSLGIEFAERPMTVLESHN